MWEELRREQREAWRAAAQDVETELHNQAVLAWRGELAEWRLRTEQARLNGVEDELNKEKSHGCP